MHTLVLLIGLAATSLAGELTGNEKQHLIEAIENRLNKSAYAYGVNFGKWPKHVAKHRLKIDAAATKKDLQDALRDALEEFNLSHLGITAPSTAKLHRSGKRAGIGVSIRKVENGLFITYVIENGPAWKVGIRKGDTVTSIDGKPLTDIKQVIGKAGEKRTYHWIRNGTPHNAELEYSYFQIADTSSMRWLNDNVAIIKIQSFQYRFYKAGQINKFINEARNAEAIILDLRNNRGGLSIYSQHLASKFSPKSEVFSRMINKPRYRKLRKQQVDTENLETLAAHAKEIHPLPMSKQYKGKVVVLVDNLSASGADIFPAFIKESGRGIVIGNKTSGALQLARNFPLPYGFRLYTPIAEILTSDGHRLEGNGLEPDILFGFRDAANDELMLKTTLEILQN